jgi:hypothetical protein
MLDPNTADLTAYDVPPTQVEGIGMTSCGPLRAALRVWCGSGACRPDEPSRTAMEVL